MTTMDSADKPAVPSVPPVEAPESSTPFTLTGDAAQQFLDAFPCKAGDTYTFTVTDMGDGKVSFDVESENPADESTESPGDEDAEQEKILGYKRPSVKKEFPPFGAKELQD